MVRSQTARRPVRRMRKSRFRIRPIQRRSRNIAKNLYGPIQTVTKMFTYTKTFVIKKLDNGSPFGALFGNIYHFNTSELNEQKSYEIKILNVEISAELIPLGPTPLKIELLPTKGTENNYWPSKWTTTLQLPTLIHCYGLMVQDHSANDDNPSLQFNNIAEMRSMPGVQVRMVEGHKIMRFTKRWIPTEPSDYEWLRTDLDVNIFSASIIGSMLDAQGWYTPIATRINCNYQLAWRFKTVYQLRGANKVINLNRNPSQMSLNSWSITEHITNNGDQDISDNNEPYGPYRPRSPVK